MICNVQCQLHVCAHSVSHLSSIGRGNDSLGPTLMGWLMGQPEVYLRWHHHPCPTQVTQCTGCKMLSCRVPVLHASSKPKIVRAGAGISIHCMQSPKMLKNAGRLMDSSVQSYAHVMAILCGVDPHTSMHMAGDVQPHSSTCLPTCNAFVLCNPLYARPPCPCTSAPCAFHTS